MPDVDTKALAARMCELSEKLFHDEFHWKYIKSQEDFRDWMNSKTQLNVDHIIDKAGALEAWVNKLEEMNSQ